MLKTHIKKIDSNQIIAHADIASVTVESLKKEVKSKGFDTSLLEGMKSRTRILEWLSVRLLLYRLLNRNCEISYQANGKPRLDGLDTHISISHSKDKIALIINFQKPTGIDIQKISKKLHAIKHKFLHPEELSQQPSLSVEKLCVYWSAKEAIYKVYGHPEIFLRDIVLKDFRYDQQGSELFARLAIEGKAESFKLRYETVEDYILAYVLNP